MNSHDGENLKNRLNLKDLPRNTWDSVYGFVQPKLKKSVRPLAYVTIGSAAILGIQNRDDVKSVVNAEIPTVKATLMDKPKFLEPQVKPIDENTEERLPAAIEAKILICNDITDSGRECREDTVYFTENDVLNKRVEIDEDTITIQKRLLESNQIRPWIRVSRER